MSGYAAVERLRPARVERSLRGEARDSAPRADRSPAPAIADLAPVEVGVLVEVEVLVEVDPLARLGERWESIRETWQQTTWYLFGDQGWR